MIPGANYCSKCGTKVISVEEEVRANDSNEIKKSNCHKEHENSDKPVKNINEGELEAYIMNNFYNQEKVEAIKYVKRQTNWSLSESKSFVDKVQYKKQLNRQKESNYRNSERYIVEDYDDYYDDSQYGNGSSGGGIIKGIVRDTAKYRGEKFNNKESYPDLLGSAGCIKGKCKQGSNFTQSCHFGCPLYEECSRGKHRK